MPRFAALVSLPLLFFAAPAVAQEPLVKSRVGSPVNNSLRVTLAGNTHPLASASNDAGPAPDSLPMERMLLLLRRGPEQEAALQKLLHDQQTKTSPLYHKWLTPREFGEQFGPSDEDLAKVKEWLSAQGFQAHRTSAGRSIIEFSGTAGQVRGTFRTEIHKYVVAGQEHWANNADPQIPAALLPVVRGIVSLHNFPTAPQKRQAQLVGLASGKSGPKPYVTVPVSGCASDGNCYDVGPTDFATIYDVTPLWTAGIDGTGQTIAIASGSNIRPADAHNFRTLFNLPSNDPIIFVDGTDPGIVPIEELYTNIMVQWTGAVAKNATIELVVDQSTSTSRGTDLAALYVIDNNIASVLAESLDVCEDDLGAAGNDFYSVLWEQAAAEGITVVIPTGDSGSAGCDSSATETAATHGLGINGVASTPFNVAVGGTDFADVHIWSNYWNASNDPASKASAKSYIPERVYNDTCTLTAPSGGCPTVNPSGSDLIAGGGGVSKYHQTPVWQNVGTFPLAGSRGVPDISMFAGDGNDGSLYIICEEDAQATGPGCDLNSPFTDFAGVGGTTSAAAAFAGVMALVNQKTGGRQGNANVVIYQLANLPSYSTTFHDVVGGTNSVACVPGTPNCSLTTGPGFGYIANPPTVFYGAFPGYDLATGWGSVDVNNLATQWSALTLTPTSTTLTNFTPTSFAHGQPVSFTVTVTPQTGTSTPTGDVALMVQPSSGPAYIVDDLTLVNGSASGSTKALPGGSYQVFAHYAGDGTFAPSNSAAIALTVTPQASQTVLSVSTIGGNFVCQTNNLEFPYGSSYAIYGIVNTTGVPCEGAGASGLSQPTGTVLLTDSGTPVDAGTYTLNTRGHFEDKSADLTAGVHVLTGAYSGDSSYNPSTSTPLVITIDQVFTTTSLSANPSTVIAGGNVTLTAIVNTTSLAAAPTGTVGFRSSTLGFLGSAPVNPVLGGNYAQAKAIFNFSPTTSMTIIATYNGDTNYVSSSSSSVPITSGEPDFSLSSQPNPVTVTAGQTGTATITVSPMLGYTGTVTLACPASLPPGTNCSLNPPSLTLASNGNAVSSTLSIGTTAPSKIPGLSAQRLPSAHFAPTFGAGITLAGLFLVLGARRRSRGLLLLACFAGALSFLGCSAQVANTQSKNSSLALTTNALKVPQGNSVTFSAAVSADHVVQGTVDFLDSGVTLASGVPVSSGRATFTTNALTVGTHSITASYSGDSATKPATTALPLFQVITGTFNVQVSAVSGTLNHTFNVNVTLQ